jgi:hypothetical protein
MRITRLALVASLLVASPLAAIADSADSYEPLDLKATEPPGPQLGTDGTGDHVVVPPRRLDQSELEKAEVRWPTLDKSEWEQLKSHYQIVEK